MFYDLNIPYASVSKNIDSVLLALVTLGYSAVAFSHTAKGRITKEQARDVKLPQFTLPNDAKEILQSQGRSFKIFTRIDVILEDQAQIHTLINSDFLASYDLVAIQPANEKLFQQCCGNLDCDIITFDLSHRMSFFLKAPPVNQAIERGIHFEISYSPALRDATARRNIISNAQGLVRITKGKNLFISSQAERALEVRGPYDISNLATLFNLTHAEGKACISNSSRAVLMHSETRKAVKTVFTVQSAVQVPEEAQWKLQGLVA
eukprot:Colp12_sorted_trinity150504_noHs@30801